MQLLVVLGVLVAINFGIVYVGSEAMKDKEAPKQGVVSVETVPNCPPNTDCTKKPEDAPQKAEEPKKQ